MVSEVTIRNIKKDLKKLKEDYMFLNSWIKGIDPETCGVGEKKHYDIQLKELYALHLYISAKEELYKCYEKENEGYKRWQEGLKYGEQYCLGKRLQECSKFKFPTVSGYIIEISLIDELISYLRKLENIDKSIRGNTCEWITAKYLINTIKEKIKPEAELVLIENNLLDDILSFLKEFGKEA